jgi:hypothetical protein
MKTIHPPHPTQEGKCCRVRCHDGSNRSWYGEQFAVCLQVADGEAVLGYVKQSPRGVWSRCLPNLPSDPPNVPGSLLCVCGDMVREWVSTFGAERITAVEIVDRKGAVN